MELLRTLWGSPPLWFPIALGFAGMAAALAGSLLRGRLKPGLRRLGACCCVTGLGLMTISLVCLVSRFTGGSPI